MADAPMSDVERDALTWRSCEHFLTCCVLSVTNAIFRVRQVDFGTAMELIYIYMLCVKYCLYVNSNKHGDYAKFWGFIRHILNILRT
jgi:hypothetical protein